MNLVINYSANSNENFSLFVDVAVNLVRRPSEVTDSRIPTRYRKQRQSMLEQMWVKYLSNCDDFDLLIGKLYSLDPLDLYF